MSTKKRKSIKKTFPTPSFSGRELGNKSERTARGGKQRDSPSNLHKETVGKKHFKVLEEKLMERKQTEGNDARKGKK